MTHVSMTDVAQRAGVHQSTVSLALRGDPRIPESTVRKVRAAAEALGYRPNPLVSALVATRKRGAKVEDYATIAFLTSYPSENGWKNLASCRRIHDAASQRAQRLGYRLETFWLRAPGMTGARMSEIFHYRNLRAAIVCPLPGIENALDMNFDRLAAVCTGYTLQTPGLHRVALDYFQSMQTVLAELARAGRRRIGLVLSEKLDTRVNHLWLGAFLQSSESASPVDRLPPLRQSGLGLQPAVFSEWLARHRPDAIVAASSECKLIRKWLHEGRGSAKSQVLPVDLHCDPASEEPGICSNFEGIGVAAVDLVTAHLQRNDVGLPGEPRTILVPSKWHAGKRP